MRKSNLLAWLLATMLLVGFRPSHAIPVQFEFAYVDQPGLGFLDPTLGPLRRAALTAAGDIWETVLEASFAGETILVGTAFTESFPGSFGNSGGPRFTFPADFVRRDQAGQVVFQGTTAVAASLANHLSGLDLVLPGDPRDPTGLGSESRALFDSTTDWWYETTPAPQGQSDFIAVALHEIGHGLGFLSGLGSDGTYLDGFPSLYDLFIDDETGRPLVTMDAAERLAAATDANGLFWIGAHGTAANGGIPPQLLTFQGEFLQGVSVSHFDDQFFGSAVMASGFGAESIPATRVIDNLTLGVLRDMGWSIAEVHAVPEPGTMALTLLGLLGLRFTRRASRAARTCRVAYLAH